MYTLLVVSLSHLNHVHKKIVVIVKKSASILNFQRNIRFQVIRTQKIGLVNV